MARRKRAKKPSAEIPMVKAQMNAFFIFWFNIFFVNTNLSARHLSTLFWFPILLPQVSQERPYVDQISHKLKKVLLRIFKPINHQY